MELSELKSLVAEIRAKMEALQASLPDPGQGSMRTFTEEERAAHQAKVQELDEMVAKIHTIQPRKPRKPRKPQLHTHAGNLGPVGTSHPYVVDKMLEVAELRPDDILYDLGSGDGRIVIRAADHYRIQAGGIEINPWWINYARQWALKRGVKSYVDFLEADVQTVNLARATVVTLFLSPEGNLALRPKLLRELRPGARVISNTHTMGDWQPARVVPALDHNRQPHNVYLWRIPEKDQQKPAESEEAWEGLEDVS